MNYYKKMNPINILKNSKKIGKLYSGMCFSCKQNLLKYLMRSRNQAKTVEYMKNKVCPKCKKHIEQLTKELIEDNQKEILKK